MPNKIIFIGYRNRPVEDLAAKTPDFKAPPHLKEAARAREFVEDAKAQFAAAAGNMPYTSTFDQIFLVDPHAGKKGKAMQWDYYPPESGKQRVAVRMKNYLLKIHPQAWGDRPAYKVVFAGFGIRNFLRLLGLECSLPAAGGSTACPLSMWYSGVEYRDIGEAVAPKDYPQMPLVHAVKLRRPLDEPDARVWDAMLLNWTGPGQNPELDSRISATLAAQLGFYGGESWGG